jgi:thiamine transport system substrate-binding protein
MKPLRNLLVISSLLALILSACTAPIQPAAETPGEPSIDSPLELRVMTHGSFAVSEDLIRTFERENNARISFLPAGDTGSALNQAILTKNAPLADVFFGVDNTFLSRALDEDIFEPYASPLLAEIPDQFKHDPQNRALPVDYGDVCINYDKAYFAENNLAVPTSLEDLTLPEYNGLLAVQNPATSSPGLAFLLATIAQYGEDGYIDYWQRLRENGVVVVNDWETAYYSNFSASSGRGPQPMVVSYGSSPPAEVIFAETPLDEAPTASITAPGTCYRQVEFVGILAGTPVRSLAEKFVDFMLSVPFQEDMPLQMFVFPVNDNAALPEAFQMYAQIPAQPAELDSTLIAANRQAWIEAWMEAVLR